MDNFIQRIVECVTSKSSRISIVINPDGFLSRSDTQVEVLKRSGLLLLPVCSSIELRVRYELYDKSSDSKVCYIVDSFDNILPDIKSRCNKAPLFSIARLLPACNEMTLLQYGNLSFGMAYYIFNKKFTSNLSVNETNNILAEAENHYGMSSNQIIEDLKNIQLNWNDVATIENISLLLNKAIKNDLYDEVAIAINGINEDFQRFEDEKYFQLVNASPIQKPKMVHKVLPHLNHKHSRTDKIALIVIDGMTYWQYLLLDKELKGCGIITSNDFTFSWLPSITQLSRQAIFRGEAPHENYSQSPMSENTLWCNYWTSTSINTSKRNADYEVGYTHGSLSIDNGSQIKIALVDTNLDDKMHALSSIKELYLLTENWAKEAALDIKAIHEQDYQIYITTDHGNIYASPWRNLTSQEKTFLFSVGSRGNRHLIYKEADYLNDFLSNNAEIKDELLVHDKWAVWRHIKSFSNKEGITHGGSHFLEVVIPFITINKK